MILYERYSTHHAIPLCKAFDALQSEDILARAAGMIEAGGVVFIWLFFLIFISKVLVG